MVQSRCGPRFSLESLQSPGVATELFGKKLQSYAAAQFEVLGFVNQTHAAAAHNLQYAIVRDFLADQTCGSESARLQGDLGMSHLVDRRYKAVTAFGDGFDVLAATVPLAQQLAQNKDVLVEVSFLDKGVGPDPLDQVVFVHQATGAFDQQEKGLG